MKTISSEGRIKQLEQQFIKNQLSNLEVFKEIAKYNNSNTFSITYSVKSYLHRISKEINLELGYLTIINITKMKENPKNNNLGNNQIIINAEVSAKSSDHLSPQVELDQTIENFSTNAKKHVSVSVNDQSSKLFKSESDLKIKDLPTANAPRFNNFERDNNNIGMLPKEDENNNRLMTTEADLFPSDARLYEEPTFKSKNSDIAENKAQQKNDSTEEIKIVELNEQTSQRQTNSSQKKSYLIFSLIKFLQNRTPFLIKKIAFVNFCESILVFVFMMVIYMLSKSYIGNSFNPIKISSNNLASFFNSYTITTLFAIREEFKRRDLIDKTAENIIYYQMFKISIEDSFNEIRRILLKERNEVTSFDYVRAVKTTLRDFASANKNKLEKKSLIVRL